MKKILLCLTLWVFILTAMAQPGCPQVSAGADQTLPCSTNCTDISASYFNTGATSTYSVASIPYTPFSYTAGTSIFIGIDDHWSNVISLPFNFCFFGNTYNQLVVGANGIITFDLSVANTFNAWNITGSPGIPDPGLQTNSIMGPYHDIDPGIGGNNYYQILGTYPCRIFVISWDNVPMYSCTSEIATQQMVLYETTNAIDMYIAAKPLCSGWNGGLAIEGIQDAAGATAYTVPGRNNTQWTATNDAYRFNPSGPSIVTVQWAGPGLSGADSVTGTAAQLYTLNVCPPHNSSTPLTSTYTATATYYRCDGTTVVTTDDMNITTDPGPVGGPDQNLGCYFPGLTATMAATAFAAATWTIVPGNPSATSITTPSSPTSTITGFTTSGTYRYLWGAGGCDDTVRVVITTPPHAGPDQSVPCAALPGGSATMAATGTGTWTPVAGNPGTAVITTPTSPTSTITTFSVAGTYSFQWGNGACEDTAKVIVAPGPDAGPDQAVSCIIAPGGSVIMAAVALGTWSAAGGNPGTAAITTPASPASTITTFSTAGTYHFVWTHGTCTDTAAVVVTTKPNAGPDQTVSCAVLPGGTATMAAVGIGTWSAMAGNPGTATITTPASNVSTITTFSVAGTYHFIWTSGGCTDTAAITVTAKPDAGPDQTVSCIILPGGTAIMAAIGTGTWTISGGNPGTATITTPGISSTTITGFSAAGTYHFIWTNAAGCKDTAAVIVTAKPNAGPDQVVSCAILPGGSASMAAVGVGTWSAMTGNPGTSTITTPASPSSSTTTFSAAGTYYFIWTSSGCTDTASVSVTAKPDAGPDEIVSCAILPGGSVAMAATGSGIWSTQPANPGTAATITPASPTSAVTSFTTPGTYHFIWTGGGCTDTAAVVVTAKPNAGPDQTVSCAVLPGGTATMAATGVGSWAALAGNPGTATIVTPSSPATHITTFSVAGTYSFVWTSGSCTDTAAIVVTAKPDAGPDQTICQYTTTTLAAVGTGTWSTPAGNPSVTTIATSTSASTNVSGFTAAGGYLYIWTSGSCTDTMIVHVTTKPDAGPDQTVCEYTAATTTASGAGVWSIQAGNPTTTTIANPVLPTTTITGFTASGAYSYIWTSNGCTDTMIVNVTAKPDAGPDQTICEYTSATMAALGTGVWSAMTGSPSATTIIAPANAATIITDFTASGAYHYIWTSNGCTDTMIVNVTAKPDAGLDQTICEYTTPTMASAGTGVWSTPAGNPTVTNITAPASAATTITGFTASGAYLYIWTGNGCTDTMTVNVTAKPDAGPDQNICQNAIATMAGLGTGVWSGIPSNPTTAIIASPSQSNTAITGLSSVGIYSFIWTVDGCTDTVDIYINVQPTLSIADSSICFGDSTTMIAVANPTGGSYLWSTGDIANSIRVSPATSASYPVTYTLGICSAQATGQVTVNNNPIVNVTTANTICTANNGVAEANIIGTAPYTYTWSGGTPGNTDTTSNLAIGSYTVTVTDNIGCSATATGTVGIDTPTVPISLLSLHDLKCNNDNTGSITIIAIDSGTITYQWSVPGASSVVSGLPAGSYQVTVTDQFGCMGTAQYTVTQPPLVTLITPSYTDPSCYGGSDGTATDTASGGSGAYHYSWSTTPGRHTQQATGLSAGSYIVTVTDDSSCVATATVTLTDPVQVTATTTTADVHCHSGSDGTAQVFPQGGTGSYTCLWSAPASRVTDTDTGLVAGSYTVTVTDTKGCTAIANAIINQPLPATVSVSGTPLTCYQNNSGTSVATGAGGSPPFQYVWSNSDSTQQISNLRAATYTVTAVDSHGCPAVDSTTLTQPLPILPVLSAISTNCAAGTDGSITITATQGSGIYTFSLEDITGDIIQSNTTGIFTGLGPDLFTAIATDQNGCYAGDTITVPHPPFNVYSAIADSTSCYGTQYQDGSIHFQNFTGANGPFLYAVDSTVLQDTTDFYHLSAGPHFVRIEDARGCDTSFTVIVGQPLPGIIDILPGDSTIALGSTLQLSSIFGPYSMDSVKGYAWSPGEGLSCIDCAGPVVSPYSKQNIYTVSVTYNQGCIATAVVRINVAGEPPLYIPNAFTPNGDGTNDVFYAYGEGIKTLKMMVFDRWGEKVFESDDQSLGWDGTFKGVLQSPGVFTYLAQVVYLNDKSITRKGTITLIR